MVKSIIIAILEPLAFLHLHKWVHGDIKPANIGIQEWTGQNARAILLDIDDAKCAPEDYLTVTPGSGGTVGWLAPERESERFSATVDVWAVGIIAASLLLGRHALLMSVNPWRKGEEFERSRDDFYWRYKDMMECIQSLKLEGKLTLSL